MIRFRLKLPLNSLRHTLFDNYLSFPRYQLASSFLFPFLLLYLLHKLPLSLSRLCKEFLFIIHNAKFVKQPLLLNLLALLLNYLKL